MSRVTKPYICRAALRTQCSPDGKKHQQQPCGGRSQIKTPTVWPPLETPRPTPPADAHTTRSICAHLPPSQSHPGAQLLWWCYIAGLVLPKAISGAQILQARPNFLVHLVILLVVLLDQDVLSEPLPCDAVDLPLLKLCLSSQPPFLKTARLGLPLW